MSLADILTALQSMSKDEKIKLRKALDKELKPVNEIVSKKKKYRKAGTLKGKLKFMSNDFDKPLEDFKEYMY
ncbi:MAG: hypothetical protein Kapaf2KO_08020 [Candidatus Kapaibacteriales bacterium]